VLDQIIQSCPLVTIMRDTLLLKYYEINNAKERWVDLYSTVVDNKLGEEGSGDEWMEHFPYGVGYFHYVIACSPFRYVVRERGYLSLHVLFAQKWADIYQNEPAKIMLEALDELIDFENNEIEGSGIINRNSPNVSPHKKK